MLKFRSVITRTITSTRLFPLLNRYMTSADKSHVVANYLVRSLGFTKDEAFNTSKKLIAFKTTKHPYCCSGIFSGLTSIENPENCIGYLRRSGFTQTEIKTMVLKSPKILCLNVIDTLDNKIWAFYDVGFFRSDVCHILSEYPAVLESTLNNHIVTTIALLKTVLRVEGDGWNEVLMTVVKQWPKFLSEDLDWGLNPLMSCFHRDLLTPRQLRTLELWETRYLSLGTDVLERLSVRAESHGILRESPMFLQGIIAMCTVSEAKLELRIGVYRQYGFTDADMLKVVRRKPRALMISVPKLSRCLEFFINVAGFRASELAEMPYLLMFSYAKMRPKYDVWKCLNDKEKINESLISCLSLTNAQFFEKYVVPFKDEYRHLYRDYVKRARPVTEGAK